MPDYFCETANGHKRRLVGGIRRSLELKGGLPPCGSAGQMLTMEQMILFSAGVVIVITVFYVFSSISENMRAISEEDQMREVASSVAGAIVASVQGPEAVIRMLIPKKIAGSSYSIDANRENVTVIIGGRTTDMPLEGLGSAYSVSGTVSSSAGRVIVNKTASSITIAR